MKAVADRNDICMVVVHHLRKQEDKDPFKQLSGTNGLNGAADGSIVLDRQKRQEGTATMSATGRDIEDMELTLDFSDCRWSRGCSPEQLQMLQLLPALQRLLADKPFPVLPPNWRLSWKMREAYGGLPSCPDTCRAMKRS